MKYLVIKQNYNWADEIDFHAYFVISEIKWESFQEEARNCGFPHMVYVGTNEEVEFDDAEQYLRTFTVERKISKSDFEVLQRVFGENSQEIVIGDMLDFREWDWENEE